MKNKIIGAMLFSTVLLSTLAATPVFAADAPQPATSKGTVSFTEATGPVDPVDPTQPGTGNTGPLTIDTVPDFAFGEHEVTGSSQKYTSTNTGVPYLQVSDRRGVGVDGKAQGWVVDVSMSEFSDGTTTLPGTKLSIGTGIVDASDTNTNADGFPAASAVDLSPATAAATILTAEKGKGLGTWLEAFDPTTVNLTVPQQAKGAFESTLTWTISAAPVE